MKLLFFMFSMLVFSQLSLSQDIYKFEFVGTLNIKGEKVMSYKLIFNQIVNNQISGLSITDFYGKNQTRTSIMGKYDTLNNTISFKELKNISKKANYADSTFCFVTAEALKIRNVNGTKIISGSFKGLTPAGEACAEGSVYLVDSKLIDKIKPKIDTKLIQNEMAKKLEDNVKILKSNQKILCDHWSKNVSIEVWDGSTPDNDMISIYLNDKILKENITLKTKKELIDLPVTENKFKLRIVALNEGDIGLNTLDFTIKNSEGEKKYISILNKGESFEIEFKEK